MPRLKDTRLTPAAIEAVKDKLRPAQYDALRMWATGERYIPIAIHLGLAIGTLKSRINRGRAAVVRHTAAMAHAPKD